MYKILEDKLDWGDGPLYPCYVLGKNELVPAFIGLPTDGTPDLYYSVIVKDKDYLKIDHSKSLVLIHDLFEDEECDSESFIWLKQVQEKGNSEDHVHITTPEDINWDKIKTQ